MSPSYANCFRYGVTPKTKLQLLDSLEYKVSFFERRVGGGESILEIRYYTIFFGGGGGKVKNPRKITTGAAPL